MDAFIQGLLVQIGCYVGLALAILFILNFASNGFFFKWIRVKGSRGQLLLVKSRNVLYDRFYVGRIGEGVLIFKDFKKVERTVSISEGFIYKAIGVNVVDHDDEKNALVMRNFSNIGGYDHVKFNNFILRALYDPQLRENLLKILLIITIVVLLACLFNTYMLTQVMSKLDSLKSVAAPAVQSSVKPAVGG